MSQNQIVDKLKEIASISSKLKEMVSGDPALEGDVDRILAISKEKWLLLDPVDYMTCRIESGKTEKVL